MMRLKSDLVQLCEAALDHRLDTVHADWTAAPRSAWCSLRKAIRIRCAKGDAIAGLDARPNYPAKYSRRHAAEGGQVLVSGGRVLCAVGVGDNVSAAQRQAYALVERISWHGMQWRRDNRFRAVQREKSDTK